MFFIRITDDIIRDLAMSSLDILNRTKLFTHWWSLGNSGGNQFTRVQPSYRSRPLKIGCGKVVRYGKGVNL